MVFNLPKLWAAGVSTRFAPFKTMRKIGDIRKAGSKLNRVRADELTLEHISEKHGDMKKFFETHKDELKNAEEMVKELYDEIRFNIADLHLLKHIIRKRYQGDENLMRQGIPPNIGHDFEAGDKHTQEEINRMLRDLGVMFGELTRVENI